MHHTVACCSYYTPCYCPRDLYCVQNTGWIQYLENEPHFIYGWYKQVHAQHEQTHYQRCYRGHHLCSINLSTLYVVLNVAMRL